MLQINSNICFYVTPVSFVSLHVWVRTRWFRAMALPGDCVRWSAQTIIYTRQMESLLYSPGHLTKDNEEVKYTYLWEWYSSFIYLCAHTRARMHACMHVRVNVCMHTCPYLKRVQYYWRKIFLTLAPSLSIAEPLNRQSHHFCRKGGGSEVGEVNYPL